MRAYIRPNELPDSRPSDVRTLLSLMPFLWDYRGRVLLALGFLILSKAANVSIPLIYRW